MDKRVLAIGLILSLLVVFENISLFNAGASTGENRKLTIMTFNILFNVPEEKEYLFYTLRICNLTENGIKIIYEKTLTPLLTSSLSVRFKVWRTWRGYTKVKESERWIRKSLFMYQNIWVYTIAYDKEAKRIYYGSWTASLDPYYNQTVNIELKVKAFHSSQVRQIKFLNQVKKLHGLKTVKMLLLELFQFQGKDHMLTYIFQQGWKSP